MNKNKSAKSLIVASGKGGVGKSMLSASLSILFSKDRELVAIDCDVDAPNLNIWLGGGAWQKEEKVSVTKKPEVDSEKCIGCGQCVKNCRFNAIKVVDGVAQPNYYLCEGCGVCQISCPNDAIKMVPADNGLIRYRTNRKYGFKVISGSLAPGESGSGKIVTEAKKRAQKEDKPLTVIDSSPGTGCPVIASLQGVDYAVLITEPTPAGKADLMRILELVDQFEIDYGVVINKHDINKEITQEIENEFEDKILGKISYDKKVFQKLTKMEPIVETDLKAKSEIRQIYKKVKEKV